jgi:hypothetical protein
VLVLIDGSDSSIATQSLQVSSQVGLTESLTRLSTALQSRESRTSQLPIEVRPKMLFNPDSRSANFMVPGLIAVILQVITTLLTAFSIVRERERGTLEQLLVTPVRPFGLMLGKLVLAVALALNYLLIHGARHWPFDFDQSPKSDAGAAVGMVDNASFISVIRLHVPARFNARRYANRWIPRACDAFHGDNPRNRPSRCDTPRSFA